MQSRQVAKLAEQRRAMETNPTEEWMADETEGQLSIDVFQDEHNVYILAPIAGVKSGDIDISITDEVITVRGERKSGHDTPEERHFTQECYWGPFSRSYVLPIAVNSEYAKATLKDGLLKIEIPKDAKVKTKIIPINGK